MAGINIGDVREKLLDTLAKLRVPIDDLVGDIPEMVRTRNTLIHGRDFYKGREDDQPELWHYMTLCQELLVRIFFALVDYEGQYVSFFPKLDQTKHFERT